MADYQLNQPGATVQQAIDKALEIEGELQEEVAARQSADALLATKVELQAEATARQEADALKASTSELNAEISRAQGAEDAISGRVTTIEGKIPTAASSANQLADKAFVNSSISTASATHRGTYNLVTDLGLTVSATTSQVATAIATKLAALSIVPDNNDYVFVQVPTGNDTPTEIARIDRYKYNGSAWGFEYSLNNSGFTAAQWAAINSGITSNDVTKLAALPTNTELTALLNGKYTKPSGGIPSTDLASGVQTSLGNADSAYQKPSGGIPSTDMSSAVQTSLGKADTAIQDISGKADKDTDAVPGNVAKFDANGNPVDSDISAEYINQLGQKTIKYFSFSGAGNTPIDAILQIVPGVKYRFYLSNTWDITGIQSACFSIQHYANGSYETDEVAYSNPASYYDITAVSAEHYLIRFRGAIGSTLGVHVEQFSSVLTDDAVTFDSVQNIVSDNIDDPEKLPSREAVINQSIDTTLSFTGNGSTGVFYNIKLIAGKTYTFKLSKTNWDTGNIQIPIFSITHTLGATITQDTAIYIPNIPSRYYVITAAEADYYTIGFRGTVGEKLSVYVEELVPTGVLYDTIDSYSAIASISNRFGMLFSIPKQWIKVKISGTIASGYRFAMKTIPDIANATNNLYFSGGINYYDSGWQTGNYECSLLNVEHTVLAIVVGKTGNGNISASEALSAISSLSLCIQHVNMESKAVNYSAHKCEMIAHRGTFFFKMPENSLDSFALAEKLGYDFIECDVRATSDGKYVIMHDASINRTCVNSNNTTISSTVNVADTSYDVLRANYVLKSNNPEYRKPIPSLEEYLYAVKSSKCKAMIELEPLTNEQVQDVYDICRSILGDGRFAFNSGQYGELDYVRSIDENVELYYETTGIIDTVSTIDGSTRNHPKNAWYPSYAGTYGQVNATVIKQYHAKGMRVGVWTVPASDFSSVIAMGVDFIATNDIVPCMSNVSAFMQRFDKTHRSDYYTTDGTVDENGIALTNGQSIAFGSVALDAGMMIIRIIAKGAFTITTNTQILTTNPNPAYTNISKAISSADFTTIEIPVLYACTIMDAGGNQIMVPRLTIAASGNSVIKNVEIYNVRKPLIE